MLKPTDGVSFKEYDQYGLEKDQKLSGEDA